MISINLRHWYLIFLLFSFLFFNQIAFAQILPTAEMEGSSFVCDTSDETKFKLVIHQIQDSDNAGQYLSCKIKTGTFNAFDIPFYLKYIADFMLGIVGLISTLFIVIGGYNYIIGSISDDKEKGKNTIKHAIYGLILALLSWAIVNTVIALVTT